MIEEAGLLKF